MNWKLFEEKVINLFRKIIYEILEVEQEKWISGDELCEQFQMFSKGWLKAYGDRLPRQRAEVNDNGEIKVSHWAYPQHKIARMIQDGTIKNL